MNKKTSTIILAAVLILAAAACFFILKSKDAGGYDSRTRQSLAGLSAEEVLNKHFEFRNEKNEAKVNATMSSKWDGFKFSWGFDDYEKIDDIKIAAGEDTGSAEAKEFIATSTFNEANGGKATQIWIFTLIKEGESGIWLIDSMKFAQENFDNITA